jgi:hypothetical protein
MRKHILLSLLLSIFGASLFLTQPSLVRAQAVSPEVLLEDEEATDSADATPSAGIASTSAEVEKKIQEKTEEDITQPTQTQKSKLARYLEENPPGDLNWNNFLQHSILYSVREGVPPNIIVLVLLFPLTASLIAASRHIIGLKGFGIYIPAVLSVALVSTGILEGLLIFVAIVAVALVAKKLLRKTKLSYLPRTALLVWTISLGIFGLLMIAPYFNLVTLMSVNIFPILILVLLSENFLDAQSRTKQADALALTIETLGLAVISSILIKWELLQKFALTDPELLILLIVVFNILIGRFTGLRIKEWFRFRSLIEEE